MVTLDDVRAAATRIAGRVHRTPTLSATSLGEACGGVRLAIKAELFQKTGSFKPRGVFNTLLSTPAAERDRGLVSLSAGNHAAALAYGATALGAKATIVMPAYAVPSKIAATRAYGGDVVLTEGSLVDTCREIQEDRGLTLVHPFDDERVIAGQGTVGLEILDDTPDVEVIVVPVGGGGLLAGIATAVKALRPDVRVIGVEPAVSDVLSRSLAAGEPVTIGPTRTIADGLAPPYAGAHTLAVAQRCVDAVVTVSDDDIAAALRLVYERTKLAVEPSGAAGVAALLTGAAGVPTGARVVAVASGGNIDAATLRTIL